MALCLDVATDVTLPIVVMVVLGFFLQRRAGVEVASLSRLVLFGTLPCLLVYSLASADLPLAAVQVTVIATVVLYFLMMAVGWAAAALFGLSNELRRLFALAAAFPNTGPFGIPVVELAFGTDYVLHQAVITSLHTVLILTTAPVLLSGERVGLGRSILSAFRTPLIPAMALGLLLNAFQVELPELVAYPLRVVGGANTPVALIYLGAQLAAGTALASLTATGLGIGLRLVIAPLIAWPVLLLLGPAPDVFALLLVGAAMPVGVLLPILCAEYRRDAQLASAMVVLSTALSPIAITLLVYLTRLG